MVHGYVVGGAGSPVLAVNGQPGRIGVPRQVVEDGQARARRRNFRIDGNPEPPGHGHGLDHLGNRLFDRILGLVRGWAGQADTGGNPANGGDQLVHLVPHEKATVAGFRPLSVLDLDGTGVLLHLRQGMDDLVPTEIAAGDLEDDVFQEPGAQQSRRAAAFPRADPHGHVQLLVQVGHAHLQALPHVGGKGAEGHAADDEGIDFPDRWNPAVIAGRSDQLLRGENPSEQGPQLEVVPSRIQRGVGEHGDANELDLVEDAAGVVAPPASAARDAAGVVVESELVRFHASDRPDGPVGANQVAHAAADAGVRRIRPLFNAVVDAVQIAGLLRQADGNLNGPFSEDPRLDGADGAHGGAPAAQGALLPAPGNLPGKITAAQCRGGYRSH